MDYARIYGDLIRKRQQETPNGYTESHHIVPKSMGGNDDRTNLVALTAREHFFAHLLLAKIHGGTQWITILFMVGSHNRLGIKHVIPSRIYAMACANRRVAISRALTGSKHSAESKANCSIAMMGHEVSDQTRTNISKALTGRLLSQETKDKMSASKKGKKKGPRSKETKRKISVYQKNRVRLPTSQATKDKIAAGLRRYYEQTAS